MKRVSVIIVSYNNIQLLRNCLDSLERHNDIGDGLETIVSDNSPDRTLYDTIKSEYPDIKIIKNENKGFGYGNNRGYEISEGEYLLFLNPDTVLVEPIFSFMTERFEKDRNLALFGIKLVKPDMRKNESFFMMDRYGISASIAHKFHRLFVYYRDNKMFIAGADLFVRRKSFEEAGRFDENIFMYKEEPDLIKRIKLYSEAKKTAYFKEKKLIHLEGGTEDLGSEKAIVMAERLMDADRYYCEKWHCDLNKILKARIRLAGLKKFVYSVLRKKIKAETADKLIRLYESNMEK